MLSALDLKQQPGRRFGLESEGPRQEVTLQISFWVAEADVFGLDTMVVEDPETS